MASGNELTMKELLQITGNPDLVQQVRVRQQVLPSNQKTRYSSNDLVSMIRRMTVIRDNRSRLSPLTDKSPQGLIQYFKPIHDHIGEIIRDSERFKELGPEIAEAAEILVSCILSPNDLQEGSLSFSIDRAELDPTIHNQVIEYLSNYFLDDCKVGRKIKGWITEALFRSGAKVLLTLPERSVAALFNTDKDRIKAGAEDSSGSKIMKEHNAKNSSKKLSNKAEWIDLAKSRMISNSIYGIEALSESGLKDMFNSTHVDTIMSKVNRLHPTYANENLRGAVEGFTVKFAAELEDGDILHISENPEILRFGKNSKSKAKENSVKAYYSTLNGDQDLESDYMPFISLLNYSNVNKPSEGHPLMMDIPTEACIPICVPGSKEEKLGYFILIDEYGYPLEAHKYLCEGACDCSNNSAAAAFNAMYGSDTSNKLVFAGGMNVGGQQGFDARNSAMANIFDYVLDTMLKHRLDGMGLGRVDVGKFNTISACMLRRFLEKKQTCLVYVPAEFITYLAYEYRDDGTGKSKLESIKTLLSIRATLMVAGMLSATNAAIPHRRIDVVLDENDPNWEQTLDAVYEMAVLKQNIGPHLGVDDIITGVTEGHTSVSPKGMGITGIEIEKTENHNSAVSVDSVLLDSLTTMIITALEVPPAALNQTSEAEFSRSVATTNIYFGNKIANKQNITTDILSDYFRGLIRHDPILINGLNAILEGMSAQEASKLSLRDKSSLNKHTDSNVDGGVLHLETGDTPSKNQLMYIVDNLRLVLPSPNVAADKAQYEEAQTIMNLINQYLDSLYNSNMFAQDSELGDTFQVMVSSLRMKIFRDITSNLGLINSFDLPTIKSLAESDNEIVEMHRILRNFKAMIDQDKILQTREPTLSEGNDVTGEDKSSSSSSFGGGGGDDWAI